MNPEADMKLEASDISSWIALYYRASTVSLTPLVSEADYAALVNGITDRRDKAIILILMESGLRANELAQLDREMIRRETQTLSDGSVRTVGIGSVANVKSREKRQFFLSSEAMQAIDEYLTVDRKDDTDRALFVGRHGSRLGAPSIRLLLSQSCDRLGIERFGLHEFRRSLAARLCESGCDLRAIKSALGCSKPQTLVELLLPPNPKVD